MQQRSGFWQAVAVTLLGHGAVLGWLAALPPAPAPSGALNGRGMSFLVRPLQPAAPAPEEPAAALPDTQASLRATTPEQRAEPAREERTVAPPPAFAPSPPAVVAAAPAQAAVPVPDAPFLPRGELTVPPRLLEHVDVPFPPDVEGIVDLKVRVTLFVDERGGVQRVRVDTPDVHPAFERSIRDAFGSARFSPGELDRVAVRSQLRLEVEFHAPNAANPRRPAS